VIERGSPEARLWQLATQMPLR